MCNINQPKFEALYHPTIEFRNEDYQWLIRASLFWDKIYRIVPQGYAPHDNENIRELCSTGEIGAHYTVSENEENSSRFAACDKFLREHRAHLSVFKSNYDNDYAKSVGWLACSKAEYELIENLKRANLVISKEYREGVDWILLPTQVLNLYMSYFAEAISKNSDYSLVTNKEESWLTAADAISERDDGERRRVFSFPVTISDIIPADLDIPVDRILRFREERADERKNFNRAVMEFNKRLSQSDSNSSFIQKWNDECTEIEMAIAEYKKSMDILNVTRFVGGLSFFGTIAGDVLSQTYPVLGGLLSVGCSIAGFLCSGKAKKQSINHGAYSYLYDIHNLAPRTIRRTPITPRRL